MLITAALGLFLHNRNRQQQAALFVETVIPQVVDAIQERRSGAETPEEPQYLTAVREMPVVEIDGQEYIGFVSIPALGLELPIMADWSYDKLQTAPCRYTGDMYADDLVIMAHNYEKHFGKLDDLRAGDIITVTDMDAVMVDYEVIALDVLAPDAIEEMTAGEYDLTLFTCTYGGKSRVTVRCDRLTQ